MECTEVFENLGFSIDVAMEGLSAFQFIESNVYSIIIADMDTPEFSGTSFLHKVKERAIDTQVLFLASDPMVEEAVEVMRGGGL